MGRVSETLLVISGGVEAIPGIQRAKDMGLHVVVVDGSLAAPGLALADDQIIASTYDVEGVIAAAKRYAQSRPIDGVIAMAADVPRTVSGVAEALGLPGLSRETADLASDKLLMKERLAEEGVAVPWFAAVASVDDVRSAVSERGYPLVMKPVDSRGARGVLRLTEGVDLDWAYGHSVSQSPSGRVMVEEFVPGPQVSTESVVLDSWATTPGFIDRNYEHLERYSPWMIENGGQQPSRLAPEDARAVKDTAVAAARALGIVGWTAKGDIVLGPDGPVVIEMAARLSGGWMSSDQIPLGTGVDFLGAAASLALGRDVDRADLEPRQQRGVAIRYFFPEPGRVTAVGDIERLKRELGVYRIGLAVGVGDSVDTPTDHTKRAGFVMAIGRDSAEAVDRAERVVESIGIETAPA